MMVPEIKEEFLVALRSGKYKQGQSYLRDSEDCYCCLGILCEIAVRRGVIPEPTIRDEAAPIDSDGTPKKVYFYVNDPKDFWENESRSVLPKVVMSWSGIETEMGSFDGTSLASLNDNGKSFAEIADIVEEKF